MLLIGQFDSPFVRRVAIAMRFYGLPYVHAPWSGFGDVDKIARYNPLRRVPTLVLDDDMVLVDSSAIIEILDDMVGPERAVLTRHGAEERRALLRWCAFAAGVADKAISLVYEGAFREGLPLWVQRCRAQVIETLNLLEAERAARTGPWLFGEQISHADIVFATMFRFVTEALPGQFDMRVWPALWNHSARCEALPQFAAAYQPYCLAMPED